MSVVARLLVLTVGLALALATHAGAAIPYKTISSAGPLPAISVGDEGSCQVTHVGDARAELFPPAATPGDCGTFVFAGGVLHGPNFPSHDSTATGSVGALTPMTPVSQTDAAGTGTAADPLRIVTVYTVGATGLRVTQTDSYVPGQEAYRTDVRIENTGAAPQTGIVYRGGDCYLQESDVGFGFLEASTSGPGCSINANNQPPGRIEQWVPLTPGSTYLEDNYSTVWAAIGAHTSLANTVQGTTSLDNGAALAWPFTIAAGGSATFSHLTVFSPTGVTGGQLPQAPVPAASPPPGAQSLPLPSNRRCTSRRAFPIRVRSFPGVQWAYAYVALNGRTVPVFVYRERRIRVTRIGAVYLNQRRFRAFIDLRGLPRGTYSVRVSAVTVDGVLRANTRRYRTCTGRLQGSIPRL